MSIVARGIIRSAATTKFTGNFRLKNTEYLISGSFSNSVPPFISSSAQLFISDEKNLAGTMAMHGKIGCDDIVLTFSNGNKIEGKLDAPACPGVSVSGAGVINQS